MKDNDILSFRYKLSKENLALIKKHKAKGRGFIRIGKTVYVDKDLFKKRPKI